MIFNISIMCVYYKICVECILWNHITVCSTSLYIILNHIASKHFMQSNYGMHITSYHIISYHLEPYYLTSCHVLFNDITIYHIISYHVISHHIISYHIIAYRIIISLYQWSCNITVFKFHHTIYGLWCRICTCIYCV